jgi:hypothetical protein
MSGSGGYYRYRCKYWLTYNCLNWVWVNNAPCAHCLVIFLPESPYSYTFIDPHYFVHDEIQCIITGMRLVRVICWLMVEAGCIGQHRGLV